MNENQSLVFYWVTIPVIATLVLGTLFGLLIDDYTFIGITSILAIFVLYFSISISSGYYKSEIGCKYKEHEIFIQDIDAVLADLQYNLHYQGEHTLVYVNEKVFFGKLKIKLWATVVFYENEAKIECFQYMNDEIKDIALNGNQSIVDADFLFSSKKLALSLPTEESLIIQSIESKESVMSTFLIVLTVTLFFLSIFTMLLKGSNDQLGIINTVIIAPLIALIVTSLKHSSQDVYFEVQVDHKRLFISTMNDLMVRSNYSIEENNDQYIIYTESYTTRETRNLIIYLSKGYANIFSSRGMKTKIKNELKMLKYRIEQKQVLFEDEVKEDLLEFEKEDTISHKIVLSNDKNEIETRGLAPNSLSIGIASLENGKVCVICKGKIKDEEEFLTCPFCGEAGHITHFLQWINTKHLCPNCRRPLKPEWWML